MLKTIFIFRIWIPTIGHKTRYVLLYIVLVLQLLVRVMLVPKVDAKSGEAAALVVFQVALVVLCLPALYCSNPNVRPWRPFAFFMIQHC